MIVKHQTILDASDRKQSWAENCLVSGLKENSDDPLPTARTICYDTSFRIQCSIGLEPARIANQAILKMMGKL
jgi:hypothetical protein